MPPAAAPQLLVTSFLTCIVALRARHTRCVSEINALSHTGVKIEPVVESTVQFDSLTKEFHNGEELQFQFKTSHPDGMLFYATRRNDDDDLVAVHISKGYLVYSFRCSQGYADLSIPKKRADDDKWHTVKFTRDRFLRGSLLFDDKIYHDNYLMNCGGFTSIVFGGIRAGDWGLKSVKSLQRIDHQNDIQFTGCLRKIKISTGSEAPPRYVKVSSCY